MERMKRLMIHTISTTAVDIQLLLHIWYLLIVSAEDEWFEFATEKSLSPSIWYP